MLPRESRPAAPRSGGSDRERRLALLAARRRSCPASTSTALPRRIAAAVARGRAERARVAAARALHAAAERAHARARRAGAQRRRSSRSRSTWCPAPSIDGVWTGVVVALGLTRSPRCSPAARDRRRRVLVPQRRAPPGAPARRPHGDATCRASSSSRSTGSRTTSCGARCATATRPRSRAGCATAATGSSAGRPTGRRRPAPARRACCTATTTTCRRSAGGRRTAARRS